MTLNLRVGLLEIVRNCEAAEPLYLVDNAIDSKSPKAT
jgi:hypothetical protein